MNPYSLRKTLRALEIARLNRLPVVNLVESGGADLPTQLDLFVPAGRIFHELTELSALAHPDGRARVRQLDGGRRVRARACATTPCSSTERAKVFLGGPPLVKMATGEDADDEALGGADMHSRVSGPRRPLRRRRARRDPHRPRDHGPAQLAQARPAAGPGRPSRVYDPDEILGIAAARPQGAVRPARGARPRSSTAPSSTSTSRSTAPRWSPAGRGCTAIRSACSPTTAACCSARRPRRPPSSSCWPTRPTRRWSSCRTPPATWSAPTTSRAGSSRTAPR